MTLGRMPLFTLAGRCLAFLLFLPVIAWEDLTQTLAEADVVTKYFDWEWALIRINNVEGPFEGADYLSAADAQVVVTAVGAVEPPVAVDKPLSTFESLVKEDTNSPQWQVFYSTIAYCFAGNRLRVLTHFPASSDLVFLRTVGMRLEWLPIRRIPFHNSR